MTQARHMLSLLEGFIILSDAIIWHMALIVKKILIEENTFGPNRV